MSRVVCNEKQRHKSLAFIGIQASFRIRTRLNSSLYIHVGAKWIGLKQARILHLIQFGADSLARTDCVAILCRQHLLLPTWDPTKPILMPTWS